MNRILEAFDAEEHDKVYRFLDGEPIKNYQHKIKKLYDIDLRKTAIVFDQNVYDIENIHPGNMQFGPDNITRKFIPKGFVELLMAEAEMYEFKSDTFHERLMHYKNSVMLPEHLLIDILYITNTPELRIAMDSEAKENGFLNKSIYKTKYISLENAVSILTHIIELKNKDE